MQLFQLHSISHLHQVLLCYGLNLRQAKTLTSPFLFVFPMLVLQVPPKPLWKGFSPTS